MKTFFMSFIIAIMFSANILNAQDWHIAGNGGTNASTNFIGTTDKTALNIRTNNVVRLSITTSGNVGIGTKTPASKLDVAGTITGFDSYFGNRYPVSAGTSGASYSSVGYGLTFTDTTANYRYRINNDYSSMISFRGGGFDFNTAPIGTAGTVINYTPVMTILQNGNVGIGTSSPANKLSVTGNANFTGNVGIGISTPVYRLSVAGHSNFTGSVSVGPSSGGGSGYTFYVIDNSSGPVASIENTSTGFSNDGLLIKTGSNTSAGARFIQFKRPDETEIGLIWQSSANTISYSTASDKRLKNIIGTTQKGLLDLMKIKIYDYTFKSDAGKNVQTGFMAQELYEIFPQAVSKPRDNNETAEKDPWMVDYGRVTPLIIKAVQEQQLMIDELKKSNEELKKQIEALKAILISGNSVKNESMQTALK